MTSQAEARAMIEKLERAPGGMDPTVKRLAGAIIKMERIEKKVRKLRHRGLIPGNPGDPVE